MEGGSEDLLCIQNTRQSVCELQEPLTGKKESKRKGKLLLLGQ